MIGDEHGADYGGCWDYVRSYAAKAKKPAIRVCEQLLSRTCEAVALILSTADELVSAPASEGVAA